MSATVDTPPMPLAARRLLVEQFTPATLREMASAMEERAPIRVACRQLDAVGIDALAEMLLAGKTPTLGWWRRHAH